MVTDRRELRRALFAKASEQGGYFTAAEARQLGYSYQAQAHHVGAGNWSRIDRGLFRLTEWIPDLHDHLIRWALWSRGQGVVSHESALAVHNIGELESEHVHLTVPRPFTKQDPAVVIHHQELSASDVMQRTGFKVTTIARSLIDVAAHSADDDQLGRVILQARATGLLTLRQLRARAEAVDVRAALHIERALQAVEAAS